jgi:hypothetical protein
METQPPDPAGEPEQEPSHQGAEGDPPEPDVDDDENNGA